MVNERQIHDNGRQVDVDEANLIPHGRQWRELECLEVDPSINKRFSSETIIKWNPLLAALRPDDRTPMHYFEHFFPTACLNTIVRATNEKLINLRVSVLLTKGELLKWLGIKLAMTLNPQKGGVSAYWAQGRQLHKAMMGLDMGGFSGMSLQRFKKIQECLSFNTDIELENERDVRPYVLLLSNI